MAETRDRDTALHRWIGRILAAPEMLAAAMLLALAAVTVTDVIGRYVFGAPIGGADELTVFMMAIGVYAVFPRISWREEHVCVDIIDLFYPNRLIALRQIAINALATVLMVIVTWRMWFLAGRLTEDGEVTEFLRFPKGPLAYFFVVMCAGATLALAGNVLRYALGWGPLQVARAAQAGQPPRD
jgi:TRAP-type C4-dicarboxylate transport system permease small subunit